MPDSVNNESIKTQGGTPDAAGDTVNTGLSISREEFRSALQSLDSSNKGQEKYARLQFVMSLISAFASVAALAIVVYMVSTLMPQVNSLLGDMQVTMTNVEKITTDIAQVDVQGMAGDIDSLVNTSEKSINEAMNQLTSIDFEGLNSAIEDLQNVISPLSRLFGGRRQ